MYVVRYLLPTTKWMQGAPTPYSAPLTVVPSGPGAPVAVHTEAVGVNSLRLAWSAPEVRGRVRVRLRLRAGLGLGRP